MQDPLYEPIFKKKDFDGTEIDVAYHPLVPLFPNAPFLGAGYYGELNPRVYEAAPGIICEQDVAMQLRDGTTIYTDIYRPDTDEKVPVIVAWSCYGKRPADYLGMNSMPGVPEGTISNMTKSEGPDPAFWCKNGYAVANVDPRGVGNSEGDLSIISTADARDGYDFVEWLGVQPWCNGNVGMAGNSMLAIMQWFIAAEQPPHLKAIAPWEGSSDAYRELATDDGVPCIGFVNFALLNLGGFNGLTEDWPTMCQKYPLMNEFWEDKRARLENITVPAYVAGGLQHLHLRGTLNGWNRISSKNKWLRLHREFEWPDQYSLKNLMDLKAFFDRYLKEIHNGWEATPRVRLDVMDSYDCDFAVERPETEFPPQRTEYRKLYLDARNASLVEEAPASTSSVAYDAETGVATFTVQFEEDVELIGPAKLKVWMEAQGADDIDLFVTVLKLSAEGEFMPTYVCGQPHPGAWGKTRVSHRELDASESTEITPVHTHRSEQLLEDGEVVPVEVEIYPMSRIWHKGEQLQLRLAGHYIRDERWFEPFTWDLRNAGLHIVHAGGERDSHLLLPFASARITAEGYTYR